MGDGMQELVVVSLTGVHILQHDIQLGAEKILEKLVQAFAEDKTLYANSYYENGETEAEEKGPVEPKVEEVSAAMRKVVLDEEPPDDNPIAKRGI